MTTLNLQPDRNVEAEQATLRQRFDRLARQVRLRLAVDGLARLVWVLVAGLTIGAVLDHTLELSAWLRGLYWLGVIAAGAHVVYHDLLRPLRVPMGPVDLAAAMDRRDHAPQGKELAPRIASVFQLDRLREGVDQPSPAMIALAVRRELDALSGLDLPAHLDQQRFLRHGLSLATAVLVPVILLVALPGLSGVWASRWLALGDTPWPRAVTITVLDADAGRIIVPRGEPFVLRADVRDKPGRTPTQTVRMSVAVESGKDEKLAMTRFAAGDFRHDFGPVTQPLTVRLWAGDGKAGPVRIIPANRPRITELRLVAQHPREPEPTVRTFAPGDGDLALLPDSQARLTLAANVPVAEARLRTQTPGLGTFERIDDRTFALAWTHDQAVHLSVDLVGEEAALGSYPVPLRIGLRADRPPRVSLRREGVKSRVTPQATVPLIASARDDYALRSLSLSITRADPGAAAREVEAARRAADRERAIREAEEAGEDPPVFEDEPDNGASKPRDPVAPVSLYTTADGAADEPTVESRHQLELSAMDLRVGDLLKITAVAADDRYGGAQSGRSRVLTFRITAPEELFREILLRQQSLRARFRKARTAAGELRDQMSVYTGEPAQAKALLAQHRLIQRTVWQVSRAMSESAEEMRLNKLGGDESYALLRREVLQPMNRLHDQTLTRQRQAIEGLVGGENDDIAGVVERQEKVLKDMDDILKRMSQWDSFIDVVNQLNEIIKIQEEVRRFTEALEENADDDVFED